MEYIAKFNRGQMIAKKNNKIHKQAKDTLVYSISYATMTTISCY